MDQTTIALIIAAIMIIGFISGKIAYGLVTITCCMLFCLTGIIDISTAFSGFCNKIVILVAAMFVMSEALTKTSLTAKIKGAMALLNGKKNLALVVAMLLVHIALCQVLPGVAVIAVMAAFLSMLPDDGDIMPSQLLFPLLLITVGWETLLPIGMGATNYMFINSISESIVGEEFAAQFLDYFKVAAIPGVLLFVYSLLIWRKMPRYKLNLSNVKDVEVKESTLPKWREMLIYILFIVIIVCLLMNQQLGDLMYAVPVVAVLILAYTKTLPTKEIIGTATSPIIWMLAGITTISSALGSSGACDVIGNTLVNMLGGSTNGLLIMIVITTATVLLTTFMNNTAAWLVMQPIAASIAMAAGLDPRGIVMCAFLAPNFAFAFPSASTTAAYVYATGNYSPVKLLKFTIPALILSIASIVLSAYFWFPPVAV